MPAQRDMTRWLWRYLSLLRKTLLMLTVGALLAHVYCLILAAEFDCLTCSRTEGLHFQSNILARTLLVCLLDWHHIIRHPVFRGAGATYLAALKQLVTCNHMPDKCAPWQSCMLASFCAKSLGDQV